MPSTMTRARGSVPENRTRTRPVPSSAASHSLTSLATDGRSGQRLLFSHPHVDQPLRKYLEIRRQLVEPRPERATSP